jgi:hypothetical protein
MKWDWRLYLGAVVEKFGEFVADVCDITGALLDKDHDWRMEQKDFEMAVSQVIESLPGGDEDTNWGGTGEDDNQGGGK